MKREIRTESYVMREGEWIPLETLPTSEREAFAARLKLTWLNELFRGKGRFQPK